MKILIVGVGGIGSHLISEIANAVKQGQIDINTEICIADNDMVEIEQMLYQNFRQNDVGKYKADVLARRYTKDILIKGVNVRIINDSQLKGYDLIICCADNNPTRNLIFTYCHRNGIDFIDLRAEGRYVMAFQKTNIKTDFETIDLHDSIDGSCQKQEDLEHGRIQYGNKIVALIGLQMFINYLRGEKNNRVLMKI
jgi:molybdopterin/thiamine biosynthesis adenylyltransferase